MTGLELFDVHVCGVHYVIAATSLETLSAVLDASDEREAFEPEEWLDRTMVPIGAERLDERRFRSDEDGELHSLRDALADCTEPCIVACSEW